MDTQTSEGQCRSLQTKTKGLDWTHHKSCKRWKVCVDSRMQTNGTRISGSYLLRKRYDKAKIIIKQFTTAGAPAISVNCDAVLFGGSLEDVTVAREAASKATLEGASEHGVVVSSHPGFISGERGYSAFGWGIACTRGVHSHNFFQ